MNDLPRATGKLLGNTYEDISGSAWLLGHDLKSPIAIIISTLEMVISLYEDDAQMSHTIHLLRGALLAARREYNMVSDMLDLARLELDQYELNLQPLNLVEVLTETLSEEGYGLEIKKIKLETQIPEQPLLVSADPELFKRIFSALIDNVIKFTVRDDRLMIMMKEEGGQVVVQFEDTGRPIFPEFQQTLLERAPQWESRQAGSRSSVGMSLPFIHVAVQAHGGIFSAKSDQATGLTYFRLSLPALKTD